MARPPPRPRQRSPGRSSPGDRQGRGDRDGAGGQGPQARSGATSGSGGDRLGRRHDRGDPPGEGQLYRRGAGVREGPEDNQRPDKRLKPYGSRVQYAAVTSNLYSPYGWKPG